jgi:hypothetical protein
MPINKNQSEDFKTVSISLNYSAVEDFYNDALKFGQLWEDTTQNERNEVRQALADAY